MSHLKPFAAGALVCLVACGGDGSSNSSMLAPSIVTQPQSTSVNAEASASFTVTASGSAPLGYQWSRNGSAVAGATSSTYAVALVTPQNNGDQYTVVITNSAGSITSATATLTVISPPGLGGSNYLTYHLDPPCSREPYGVVYNYDTATATISAQLQQMYAGGQRRLRIPIFHGRGLDTGTVMDSTGGNLAARFRGNLTNLLAAIKATGFLEIEVSFNPQGGNDATQWTTFSDDYYQENWNLIQNLRPLIAGAGLLYHIDLLNEGIPPQGNAAFLQYSQELWNDYVAMFGSSNTIGFSIIADAAHLSQVSVVYGPSAFGNHGSPQLFSIHIYDETESSFQTAFTSLKAQGYQGIPWIVGEAFYNDAAEAASLSQAAGSTGQVVLYLTQWPETADRSCDPNVNVAPPLDFSNYQAQGF
jgi:Immunoglobulin I-set domain